MINKLRNWFLKLVSSPLTNEKNCEMCCNYEEREDSMPDCEDEDEWICDECRAAEEAEGEDCEAEDSDNTVAYFTIAVSKDDQLLVEGDFRGGHEEDMSRLVFLLSSGALSDFAAEIVLDRCDDDVDAANVIMDEAYRMIGEYFEKEGDDDEPVVDPCEVFNPRNGGEEDE